jgi:hypothetical protein
MGPMMSGAVMGQLYMGELHGGGWEGDGGIEGHNTHRPHDCALRGR